MQPGDAPGVWIRGKVMPLRSDGVQQTGRRAPSYCTVHAPNCCQCVSRPVLSNAFKYNVLAPPNVLVLKDTGIVMVTVFPVPLLVIPMPETVQRLFERLLLVPGVTLPGTTPVPPSFTSTTALPAGTKAIWQGDPPTILLLIRR